jgi:superfamily II DNA or RNA helicase
MRGEDQDNLSNYLEQIQQTVNQGKKPYQAMPVPQELLTHRKPLELYDYQYEAVHKFLLASRSIILYPTGFGKTFVGMEIMNQIKPRYLIIANKTAIPQWKERIAKFTEITETDYDIFTFQSGIKKAINNQYNLVIIDEAHYSLADTYSELLAANTKTIVALTASPYRTDGRDSLLVPIFVNPVGGDWKNIHNAKYYNPPTIHIWVHANEDKKLAKLTELMQTGKKTLIYSDNIATGKDISTRFKIPFVNGDTPSDERIQILNNNKIAIVSRVGDESISVDGVEVGIEVDWHGRSSRQAIQRAGRLMHNKNVTETQHHIIMTADEYKKDKERFNGYYEKGMKVVLHKEAGINAMDLILIRKESKKTIFKKIDKLLHKQAV